MLRSVVLCRHALDDCGVTVLIDFLIDLWQGVNLSEILCPDYERAVPSITSGEEYTRCA